MQKKNTRECIEKRIFIDKNKCWIWSGARHRYGYGVVIYEGKVQCLHRLMWIFYKGNIPDKMEICHNCPNGDNPLCCNPEHMFLGTHKQNLNDCKNKTGHQIGEKNCKAILTEKKVLKMRELHAKGKKIKEIAESFGLKYYTCLDVINRRNWSHF